MDSLLSTIQEQYFSAVASTLSRAIVLASSTSEPLGAAARARRQKVSPTLASAGHRDRNQKHKSLFDPQARREEARQQQQPSRRRALNKQQRQQQQPHQRQSNANATTSPLDLSKRRLTDHSEPPLSSSNLAPVASSSLLFPLNLVTKSEQVSNGGGAISNSGLAASSTNSPASTGSPTSSLSSSSAISSSGPLSSEFEGRSRNGAASELANKSQEKKRQRRRPTKKLKGAKSHMCGQCGRSFSRSDMLTRHSRLHSGLKPYQCAKCLQVFSRSDHLSTHERTHTGEKPYQCRFCSYSACRRDMITRHMRTHTIGALVAGTDPSSLHVATSQYKPKQASQKSQQSRRRQNNEPDGNSPDTQHNQLFQNSHTGPTQKLVPTQQIEHFHRP